MAGVKAATGNGIGIESRKRRQCRENQRRLKSQNIKRKSIMKIGVSKNAEAAKRRKEKRRND